MHESGEMYLETIYLLSQKQQSVRSLDVAEHMGFSKPSVSRAVSLLKQGGYITVEEDGMLVLTEEGKQLAAKIYERHTILSDFLVSLGVDAETASVDACKIEHHISDTSFAAIKQYMSNR